MYFKEFVPQFTNDVMKIMLFCSWKSLAWQHCLCYIILCDVLPLDCKYCATAGLTKDKITVVFPLVSQLEDTLHGRVDEAKCYTVHSQFYFAVAVIMMMYFIQYMKTLVV